MDLQLRKDRGKLLSAAIVHNDDRVRFYKLRNQSDQHPRRTICGDEQHYAAAQLRRDLRGAGCHYLRFTSHMMTDTRTLINRHVTTGK